MPSAPPVIVPVLLPAGTTQTSEDRKRPAKAGGLKAPPTSQSATPVPGLSDATTELDLAALPFAVSGSGLGDDAIGVRLADQVAQGICASFGWKARLSSETTGPAMPAPTRWTPASVREVGAKIGAKRILTGEVIRAPGHATVRATVRDVETGQPLASAGSLLERGRDEATVQKRLAEQLLDILQKP